jgi:hypothetical protein
MKYTKDFLEEVVLKSTSMWDVVKHSGVSKQEGNYRYIRNLINRYNISTDHFEDQRKGFNRSLKPISEYLVKDQFLTLSGNRLKSKLFSAGLKENKCEECGQDEIWRGKKISLILDHRDGDRKNNELDNLRIICPNCNATLDTHCGKNKK